MGVFLIHQVGAFNSLILLKVPYFSDVKKDMNKLANDMTKVAKAEHQGSTAGKTAMLKKAEECQSGIKEPKKRKMVKAQDDAVAPPKRQKKFDEKAAKIAAANSAAKLLFSTVDVNRQKKLEDEMAKVRKMEKEIATLREQLKTQDRIIEVNSHTKQFT